MSMNSRETGLFFCLICVLFLSFPLYGQKINGTVTHQGKPVPSANVLLQNTEDEILQYTFTDEKGKYSFLLKPSKDSVLTIKVNAISYEPQSKVLKKPFPSPSVVHDFQMQERITDLKEVVVKARQPIVKKNDTITYNIEAFMDGSEKVVEDLLKKLPGISIEADGTIKYNGKKIEKMLLGGDDLFGGQYTIGSKNISMEMVDSIQAVEHYHENRLLDGITNSEEVALNIILKKEKTDFSGNGTLGYGYRDRYLAKFTGLLMNKKSKGFFLASHNNIGNNNTPYNFLERGLSSVGAIEDRALKAPTLISSGSFHSQLKDIHVRQNNTFYTSLNVLHKFAPDFSAKLNFDLYDDRLRRTNTSNFNYFIEGDTLHVKEMNRMQKKPRLYTSKIQLSDERNPYFIWKYQGNFDFYKGNYTNWSTKNGLQQKSNVSTKNFFTDQNANFTYRKKENNAVEGAISYSKGDAPQEFILSPGIYFNENGMETSSNFQSSQFERESFEVKLKYYQKHDNLKWDATAGYNFQHDKLFSLLSNKINDSLISLGTAYENSLGYKNNTPYLKVNSVYQPHKRHKFRLTLNPKLYYFSLTDPVQNYLIDSNHFTFDINFYYTYSFNSQSSINLSYFYKEIAPKTRFLHKGVLLTGYRSLRNNEPRFDFIDKNGYGLSYRYKNLANLTELNIGIRADYGKNGYFFRQEIDFDRVISTAFLLETGTENYHVNLRGEQYIHFLRTTFSLKGLYTLSFDKNLINDSNLRNIKRQNLRIDLHFSTGFDGPLNFYGGVDYFESAYFLEDNKQHKFRMIKSSLTEIYTISKTLMFTSNLSFLMPDMSKTNQFLFLDAELQFKPKESPFQYSIIGRNLTGNQKFETYRISDYYTAISSYRILEPTVMLSAKFSF